VGDTVKFTIVVRNQGPITATGVKVAFILPFGLEFISASQGGYDPQTGIWNIGTLAPNIALALKINSNTLNLVGGVNDLNVKAKAPQPIPTTLDAFAVAQESDPDPANNQGTVNTDTQPNYNQNPDNETGGIIPDSQLAQDIAGVRKALAQGDLNQSVLPDWTQNLGSNDVEFYDKVLIWTFALIVGITTVFLFLGSEIQNKILMSIMGALSAVYDYLSYLGTPIGNAFIRGSYTVLKDYGIYIINTLQDWGLIPLLGVYIDTGIGLTLDILGTRFPFLQELTKPAADVLYQYTIYQILEKLGVKILKGS
jgi:uncharacterized repeat protein (TIGR01451 family)